MSTTTKLKEFQVSEYNILNLFAYSGSIPVTAGTAVYPLSTSGWRATDSDLNLLGAVGATYGNTVSNRWGPQALVRDAASGDGSVLGLLRYDVRETDENGMPLKFYPQKAAENNWILSGQAVPIITKGFVFISGQIGGTVQAGAKAYVSGAGELFAGSNASTNQVGIFWGGQDYTVQGTGQSNFKSYALLEIKIP